MQYMKWLKPSMTGDLWKVFWYFSFLGLVPLGYLRFFVFIREEIFVYVFLNSLLFMVPLLVGLVKSRFYVWIMGGILFGANLISLFYAVVFKSLVTKHIYYVVFDTNMAETKEFFGDFLGPSVFVILALYTLAFLFLSKTMFNNEKLKTVRSFPVVIYFILLPLLIKFISLDFSGKNLIGHYGKSNAPLQGVISLAQYLEHISIIQKAQADEAGFKLVDVKSNFKTNKKQVHVLLLGEALTTTHMSLYGYQRDTNPLLSKMRNELLVFNNVECTDPPVTDINLQRMLTLKTQQDDSSELLKVSILKVMKEVGAQTYWLSNQNSMGARITMITAIANKADKLSFVSDSNRFDYDERIFPSLDRMLAEASDHKFIVIHINGGHNTYAHRYPDKFERWKDEMPPYDRAFHNKSKRKIINEYDNAVLYNDYIVFTILEKLKKLDAAVSFVYVPDHGEEVYETEDRMGHGGSTYTKGLFSIPFIIWGNNTFWSERGLDYVALKNLESRKYTSDMLIYTLMDLYSVDAPFYKPEESLIRR
jgi:heptose-I-phosphate ethanolaminephosphotransferase